MSCISPPGQQGGRPQRDAKEKAVETAQACIHGACSPQWAPMILALT
jgi:hypothetical protein